MFAFADDFQSDRAAAAGPGRTGGKRSRLLEGERGVGQVHGALPAFSGELERVSCWRTSGAPGGSEGSLSGRKLVFVSFQVNSIQRPPSCGEKTARTFCDSRIHSGAPSPSRSAVQATVRPRGNEEHAHRKFESDAAAHLERPDSQAGCILGSEYAQARRDARRRARCSTSVFGGQKFQALAGRLQVVVGCADVLLRIAISSQCRPSDRRRRSAGSGVISVCGPK